MNRAQAKALVLVNWKGVFYERYLLDQNVTALEGPNGAGKTTVMVAAYVALLPDLGRLRFTNVGERGESGGDKGIWGRLGEKGRPSYVGLLVQTAPHTAVLMGVHLERKSEPSLELSSFLVHGLDPEVTLSELFLQVSHESEEVPTFKGFKAQLKAFALRNSGVHAEFFPSTKEYLAALFELGISPLRLSSEEERGKFNEMLRTSMTGGISKALTSELRNFVFKQEAQLSDTLSRMRGNLGACRRTRMEVAEARKLETEISGIFDAGQAVFRSAYFCTLADRDQGEALLFDARTARDELAQQVEQLGLSIRDEQARKSVIEARVEAHDGELEAARNLTQRVLRAREIKSRLDELVRERTEAEKLEIAAALKLKHAAEVCRQARADRSAAQNQLTRSASALADLQTGLDELHHQARAHRRLMELSSRLSAELDDPAFSADDAPRWLLQLAEQIESLDQRRTGRSRARKDLEQQRSDHQRALKALAALDSELSGSSALESTAPLTAQTNPELYELARQKLVELEKLESLVSARQQLELETERLVALALRQKAGRERFDRLKAELGESAPADYTQETLASETRALESNVLALQNEHRERLWQNQVAVETERSVRLRQQQLEEEQERWQQVLEAAARLEESYGELAQDKSAVTQRQRQIQIAREQAAARQEQLLEHAQDCLRRADKLEAQAGDFPADLLRVRDELEGELLARRFEQLSATEARQMQAKLGPLLSAVVVSDLEQAVKTLEGKSRELDDIWLVDPEWQLEPVSIDQSGLQGTFSAPPAVPATETEPRSEDVVVRFHAGARISRLPKRAVLGHTALQAEVKRLRQEAVEAEQQQQQASLALRDLSAQLEDVRVILDSLGLWMAGGPRWTRAQTETDVLLAQKTQEQSRRAALELRERITKSHALLDSLREMATLAHWLEGPAYEKQALATKNDAARAQQGAATLQRCVAARKELEALLYCLKAPPPTDDELALWEKEDQALSEERDQLFRRRVDLEELVAVRQGAAFGDASVVLSQRKQLVPALEDQAQQARVQLAEAEERVLSAEATAEALSLARQERKAQLLAIQAHAQRVEKELAAVGLVDCSLRAEQKAAQAVAELEKRGRSLRSEQQAFATAEAVSAERLANIRQQLAEAERRLTQAESAAAPKNQAWLALEQARKTAGVAAPRKMDGQERSQWPEVDSRVALLCDRLIAARGSELAERARSTMVSPRPGAETYLTLWGEVRSWLKRRLPTQVADVAEPQQALARLRADLEGLEQRLGRQETQLRGNSEDVARSIDVQLRKASAQVRRLNQYLHGVTFGGISGIRVQQGRVEKMAQVLNALRDGSAQALLFQSNLPIEEALDEIFKRYGGGGGGGQRILDYREYLELGVQVQRRGQSTWEAANPSRVSTGEAIGVGAALMMVILTEWERDANLLRKKQPMGSLRFLFLDEANRLSQENLSVLFELCQALELQLLIAAPEVAQAHGNTTYRLVRRSGPNGRDEVVVSGRRAVEALGSEQETEVREVIETSLQCEAEIDDKSEHLNDLDERRGQLAEELQPSDEPLAPTSSVAEGEAPSLREEQAALQSSLFD